MDTPPLGDTENTRRADAQPGALPRALTTVNDQRHPEYMLLTAFVGGLALAVLLRRLAR